MVWSLIQWVKTALFLESSLSNDPMPESGDVDVLTPLPSTSFSPARQSFADRRRIGLKLDISSFQAPEVEEFHMRPKKCKLESMALASKDSAAFKTMCPGELNGATPENVLVLNCRTNPACHLNHLQGPLHLNCQDRWAHPRLQAGKGDVVSRQDKDIYDKVMSKDVVVYEDQAKDLKDVPSDNSLQSVLSSLSKDGRETFVLADNLKGFLSEHKGLVSRSTQKRTRLTPLYSPTTNTEGPSEPGAIETASVSRVLPCLYLGNARDAADLATLRRHNITYVLNTTAHLPLSFEKHNGIKYKRIPASDSSQQNLKQYFEEAIEFIDDAKQNGCNVLVHCQAGVSRSATITIAYILKHTKMTMSDAYKFVKGKRPIISPNFNFLGQLMEFEQDLNRGTTHRILKPKLQGIETVV